MELKKNTAPMTGILGIQLVTTEVMPAMLPRQHILDQSQAFLKASSGFHSNTIKINDIVN